jgi:hypothetical protein
MTKRFSQTPPDKANELFEKLLASSDNATKARERLFQDLKEELELLANLQEEHLFPVLTQHGMQDLLQQATKDNQETAALLSELEQMPKNTAEFIGKVAELRQAFQQHIRDDRKELLPAVLKVLSDEEATAVVEKVEDEMATLEETRRGEAQASREQVETVQQVTEDTAGTLRTVTQSSTTLLRGLQDVSDELVDRSQRRLRRNLDGLQALARCRSMADFVEVQTALLRDNLEQTIENTRRIAELTIQMTDEATRTVAVQVEKTTQRLNRAA